LLLPPPPLVLLVLLVDAVDASVAGELLELCFFLFSFTTTSLPTVVLLLLLPVDEPRADVVVAIDEDVDDDVDDVDSFDFFFSFFSSLTDDESLSFGMQLRRRSKITESEFNTNKKHASKPYTQRKRRNRITTIKVRQR
jgi:hypothetical protein